MVKSYLKDLKTVLTKKTPIRTKAQIASINRNIKVAQAKKAAAKRRRK
jgi:hypothetical protein